MRFATGPFLLAIILSSCGPSYPKERVGEALVELCRKEYDLDVKAKVAQTTLGAQISIPGLIEELMKQSGSQPEFPPPIFVEGEFEREGFHFQFLTRGQFTRVDKEKGEAKESARSPKKEEKSPALNALDHVLTAMRRVALSTDAPLEFYVLLARDPSPANLEVVFSGHLTDMKRVQYYDISIGELQRRSRVFLQHQAEPIAEETIRGFLKGLTQQPLPQLLGRTVASSKRFAELFHKILELAIELQGREQRLLEGEWAVLQTERDQCLVAVPLSPIGKPGALLFTVQLREGQGAILDLERLDSPALPAQHRHLGEISRWKADFYLEPLVLSRFLSEQIAKRVLSEFKPYEPAGAKEEPSKPAQKEKLEQPASQEDVLQALVETSAYILYSYRFNDFKSVTVTDAVKGTRWEVPAKDLPMYRRRGGPSLQPLP